MKVVKAVKTLEGEIIQTFRRGNVVTLSQLTAQVVQDPAFRLVSTPEVKKLVLKLEKDALVVRERTNGITYFRWNTPNAGNADVYTIAALGSLSVKGESTFSAFIHRKGRPYVTITQGPRTFGEFVVVANQICKALNLSFDHQEQTTRQTKKSHKRR